MGLTQRAVPDEQQFPQTAMSCRPALPTGSHGRGCTQQGRGRRCSHLQRQHL